MMYCVDTTEWDILDCNDCKGCVGLECEDCTFWSDHCILDKCGMKYAEIKDL